jgi:transposase
MSLRRLIVEVELEGLNVRRFCAEHGISTWFFYALRRRFAAGGLDAIEVRSRAPRRVANRTAGDVEDAIVAKRKELLEAGLDAGPATIRFHLETATTVVPSESTIWRVLHRRGFIVPDPSKAPKRPARSFAAERANECWQTDDTSWVLADGTPVKVINVVDDCTRVAVATRAVAGATAATIFETFTVGAAEWGWPERVLCDNARAHHGLAAALTELGIATGHSRPYHPQTCGKVERFHQTVKRFLAARDPAETITDLQGQLDAFRRVYNQQRPHRSLARRIPADVWATTPKSGPASRALAANATEIHRGTVKPEGRLPVGRRYAISLGNRYAGDAAITVITGTACHVFIDGQLARKLTLNPTRRNQPLHNRPGRPTPSVSDVPRHP